MILYRTPTNDLFVRNPNEQFFTDKNADRFYMNFDGKPTYSDGTEVAGHEVTKFYYTVDEFIQAFPEAEQYRNFLTDKRGTVALVQSASNYTWFTGNTFILTYYPAFQHPKNDKYSTKPTVLANDGDDSYMRKVFDTEEEAQAAFNEILTLAPLSMQDMAALGYQAE